MYLQYFTMILLYMLTLRHYHKFSLIHASVYICTVYVCYLPHTWGGEQVQ